MEKITGLINGQHFATPKLSEVTTKIADTLIGSIDNCILGDDSIFSVSKDATEVTFSLKSADNKKCPIKIQVNCIGLSVIVKMYFEDTGPIIQYEMLPEDEVDSLLNDIFIILNNSIKKECTIVSGQVVKTKYTFYQSSRNEKTEMEYFGGQLKINQLFYKKMHSQFAFEKWTAD